MAFSESESSHILVVPFVIVWLAWNARQNVAHFPSGGCWLGSLISSIGVMLWSLGYTCQVQSMWHFGAVATVSGALLFLAGSDYFWGFLPAWGAVLFFIPVPIRARLFIALPLERLAAIATQGVGEVLGLTVSRSGNQLSINQTDICIIEACNGMRLVFTLLLACYLAVFIRPYKVWIRAAVLGAGPIIAMISNVIRLVPTLWIYAHCSSRTAETFHDIAGAVMVVLAFGAVTTGLQLLDWVGLPLFSVPKTGPLRQHAIPMSRLALAVMTGVVCVAACRKLTLPDPSAASEYHEKVRIAAAAIPKVYADWVAADVSLPRASLEALKTNVAISRRCTNRVTGRSVDLLILQSPDIRDLIPHYPPVCYPGQGLTLNGSTLVTLRWDKTIVSARRYCFEWHDFRRGDPTVVDNFLVLPTGRIQPDTAGIERQIGSGHRYFGCAQVQVVYHDAMSPQEQTDCTQSVLEPYLPLLALIEEGDHRN